MAQEIDQTNFMPEASNTSDAQLGNALMDAMNGNQQPVEAFKQETSIRKPSNLDNLEASEGRAPEAQEAPASAEVEEMELKVKGLKAPVTIKKNWEDPEVQSLLNKGARFEVAMQEVAAQRKALEAKIERYQDYEDKAAEADKVATARKLIEQGYHEQAMAALLGESSEDVLGALIENKIRYQNASPEERLEMDLERQKRNEQLQRQKDADRIAKLEAQINARSEQAQEAEFTGYIQDARSRYDMSQWVDDIDAAESYNDMIHNAAMADVIKLQRQREARGGENITQRDIQKAYATRAKIFVDNFQRQSQKIADEKVSAQTKVAKQNAQVASAKNYGQTSQLSDWQKSGGSMSDFVDFFRRGV